jgi:hypothetical protein
MARSLSTDEARATCEAAAAAAGRERPASQLSGPGYRIAAPPEVAGEWRLVNNSRGGHVLLAAAMLRGVTLVAVQPWMMQLAAAGAASKDRFDTACSCCMTG